MASGWEKRVWCCAKFGEILLIGEQLRIDMHSTNSPTLIRDRRYFMKTYPSCFAGNETVDWLCKSKQVPNRDMAVVVMTILIDNNILHNVAGSGPFKDDSSLYRFKKDDGTYPWVEDFAVFNRGKRLYERLKSDKNGIIRKQTEDGRKYAAAFSGRALVNWLMGHQEATSREEAVRECKLLLQNDVIRHVTDSQHFKDDELLYQFKINFNRKLCLLDLVIPPEQDSDSEDSEQSSQESQSKVAIDGAEISRVSLSSHHLTSKGQDVPTRSESGYHSDLHDSPTSPAGSFHKQASSSVTSEPDRILQHMNSLTVDSPSGILIRKATEEELTAENSPYFKRHIRVAQDPVGYGIVVRGEGPVFVKAVDPMGPAAKAGLKVGHYIYSINDEVVLQLNYRELGHRVIDSNGYMNIVVYEHIHDQRAG